MESGLASYLATLRLHRYGTPIIKFKGNWDVDSDRPIPYIPTLGT